MHYKRWKNHGTTEIHVSRVISPECSALGCGGDARHAPALCDKHYKRFQKYGLVEDEDYRLMQLERRGRTTNPSGYVYMWYPEHPNATSSGSLLEHIYVMSKVLGRPVAPGEYVHHRNGIRNDNHPENLELWATSQPPGQRVVDLVHWAEEILARYGDEIVRGTVG